MSERYLADENFPAAIVRLLRQQGNELLFAAETLSGVDDESILQRAVDDDRIILTFDRDFGELVVRHGKQVAGVVLFRLRQQSPEVVLPFLESFFATQASLRGWFTVASPGHFRQRPLV